MFKKAALAAVLLLFSGQAQAAIIEFSGGEGDYIVNGRLEYDPARTATTILERDGSTYYGFDGGRMSVSLNGQPYRAGALNLGASVQTPAEMGILSFYSTITALLTWDGPITDDEPYGSEYFSMVIFFPGRTVVQDGKIVVNLAGLPSDPFSSPPFGEITYFSPNGSAGIILDDLNFVSPVPEPAAWAYMLLGFLGCGVLIRRRKQKPALAGDLSFA